MLHILNGSSTEQTLRQTSIAGDLFSFRDALIAGPASEDLDEISWCRTRAEHLSEDYGVSKDESERDLLLQTEMLGSFAKHDEIVLWFEHDLFCQLNLLYLLNWFGNVETGKTKLSLINVGAFPGKEHFRGIGELNADELACIYSTPRIHKASTQTDVVQVGLMHCCHSFPLDLKVDVDSFFASSLVGHFVVMKVEVCVRRTPSYHSRKQRDHPADVFRRLISGRASSVESWDVLALECTTMTVLDLSNQRNRRPGCSERSEGLVSPDRRTH